ncbi:MAG: MFS transporter [Spirochaetaceae bacterium]|nr:MAG: MFS transporter [Spirochaetaceae bacterium]
MRTPVNTVWYLLFRFFQDCALVYPVYLIYFRQVGLDFVQISWLLAIWGAPVMLMEVPFGVLADLWSRKWSLVLGMLLKSAGFIVWLVRPDFVGFAAGFVLWGLQEALCTGTTDALLYDWLKQSGAQARFVELSGRGLLAARIGVVFSVLLGGWVFSRNPAAVLILSAASMVVAAACALLLRESRAALPGGAAARTGRTSVTLRHNLAAISDTVRQALTVRNMVPVVVFGSLATVVYGVLDEYDFLFGRHAGVPLAVIGVWGAARFIMEGAGASISGYLERRLGLHVPGRLALWMLVAGLLLIGGVATGSRLLLPLYFIFFFMMAAAEILFMGWVQHRVASVGRATFSSLVSFVYELLGLGLVLASGYAADRFGLPAVFIGGGLAVAGAAAVYGLAAGVRG